MPPIQSGKSDLAALTDRELVSHILETAQEARKRRGQEELYRRYSGKVYYKCLTIVKDPEVAKDMAHDIFVKIFLRLDRYKGQANFYSWVFAITYNHCFDFLRQKKKMYTVEVTEMHTELAEDTAELEHKLLKEANLEIMEGAMQQLSEMERTMLTMFYQDGMSIKMMAKVLGLGESAIKMRLKRSRNKLAQLIQKSMRDGSF